MKEKNRIPLLNIKRGHDLCMLNNKQPSQFHSRLSTKRIWIHEIIMNNLSAPNYVFTLLVE